MKPEHRGQEFSDFLDELGIRGEVEAQAIKEILGQNPKNCRGPKGTGSPRKQSPFSSKDRAATLRFGNRITKLLRCVQPEPDRLLGVG